MYGAKSPYKFRVPASQKGKQECPSGTLVPVWHINGLTGLAPELRNEMGVQARAHEAVPVPYVVAAHVQLTTTGLRAASLHTEGLSCMNSNRRLGAAVQ